MKNCKQFNVLTYVYTCDSATEIKIPSPLWSPLHPLTSLPLVLMTPLALVLVMTHLFVCFLEFSIRSSYKKYSFSFSDFFYSAQLCVLIQYYHCVSVVQSSLYATVYLSICLLMNLWTFPSFMLRVSVDKYFCGCMCSFLLGIGRTWMAGLSGRFMF